MNVRKLSLLLGLSIMTLSFQNCGEFRTSVPDDGLILASSTCAVGSLTLFESTFYPFVSQQCISCHAGAGPGPGFANPDVGLAWGVFQLYGGETVFSYATNNGHAPPYTGSANNAVMQPIYDQWQQATANSCSSGGTAGAGLMLAPQAIGLTQTGTFGVGNIKTITWDLGTQLSGASFPGVKLSINIYPDSNAISATVTNYDYVLDKPILTTASSPMHIKGLHIYINNAIADSTITIYPAIDSVVPASNTTLGLVASGVAVNDEPYPMVPDPTTTLAISATDTISVGIDLLEVDTVDATTTGLPVVKTK